MPNERLKRALDGVAKAAATVNDYLTEVASRSSELSAGEWLEARARLGTLLADFDKAGKRVDKALGLGGANPKLLRYLLNHPTEVVTKDELSGVAGIYEFARRLRELRVEEGWPIASSLTRDDLPSGSYLMESDERDEGLAEAWHVAKRVRNLRVDGRRAGMKARYLEYLQAIFPKVADKQQLSYVAYPGHEPRRIRELVEEGWQIVSNVDDANLPPGSYRMTSLAQLPPRAREAIKLRHQVFDRDGTRCVDCGRSPRTDRVQLQAHHKVMVSKGGANTLDNLVTLCADCHAGRHALAGRGLTHDELLDPTESY